MAQNYRLGIGGIQKKIDDEHRQTDAKIQTAFQDLQSLMGLIKEMVALSKSIKEKLQKKGSDISTDQTVLFRSHLLSLGVSDDFGDPVQRSSFNSDNKYYAELAKQIAKVISPMARSKGGQISLPEVFCVVNRARGLDLISPEDLLNACTAFDKLNLGLKLLKYDSGLIVLQSDEFNQNSANSLILDLLTEMESITAQDFALKHNISIALARQRLLDAEGFGLVCRDESPLGLLFFPNKFMS